MSDQEIGILGRIVPEVVRRRFLVKFLTAVVVAMVVMTGIGGVLYLQASNTLDEQVDREVESTAAQQADTLENWIDGLRHQTRTLTLSSLFERSSDSRIQLFLSDKLSTFREGVVAIHYVNTSTGRIAASSGIESIDTSFADTGMPWAQRLSQIEDRTDDGSQVVVADRPYESPATGERVVAMVGSPPDNPGHLVVVEANLASREGGFYQSTAGGFTSVRHEDGPVVYDGSSGGVAGETVTGSEQVAGTDWTVVSHLPKEQAFALQGQISTILIALIVIPLVLIGGAAAVIGHRTGSDLTELADQATTVESGDLDEQIEVDRSDELGDLASSLDSMRQALEERIREAERARKEAEVARSEAVAMNEHLQERADEYAETMQQCAAGDLTRRMEPDGENDAMDRIAGEFNDMVDELEKTTGQLKRFADEVETAGEEVRASAGSVQTAAEEIATASQQVADDTTDQEDVLADVQTALRQVVETVEAGTDADDDALVAEAELALEHVEAASETTDRLLAEFESIAGAAEEQAAELDEVAVRAEDLTRYAGPLRDVLDRFETDAEREFYFPTGPGSPPESRVSR